MKTEIIKNIHNAEAIESMYRSNKSSFKQQFIEVLPQIEKEPLAQAWQARLQSKDHTIQWSSTKELLLVMGLGICAGLIAKIPDFFNGMQPEVFYPKNIGFIFLPALSAYFLWKNNASPKQWSILGITLLISVCYINLLPNSPNQDSDTIVLACLHLPLILWSLGGFSFTIQDWKSSIHRIRFLKFNADMLIICAVIAIAGAILSGITMGLFSIIGLQIEEFYMKNIGIMGASAIPIVGAFLVQNNPQLVKNVSPIIAKVFTPLVLIMLTCYLVAMLYTGKDPYQDRDFLIVFNLLLIGVMALILFSITESTQNTSKFQISSLFLLSVLTIIINSIALSAIVYRIAEWGITPNRIAVLGSNLLMLVHLVLVSFRLYTSLKNPLDLNKVEERIASYLPLYTLWAILIVFILPFLFGFK
jgi:hypothetical protein